MGRQLLVAIKLRGHVAGEAVLQQRGIVGHAVVGHARARRVGTGNVTSLGSVACEVLGGLVVAAARTALVIGTVLGEAVQRGRHGVEVRGDGCALVHRVVAAVRLVLAAVVGVAGVVALGIHLQLVGHLGDDADVHAAARLHLLARGIRVVLGGLAHREDEVAVLVVLLVARTEGAGAVAVHRGARQVHLRIHGHGVGIAVVGEHGRHGQAGGIALHPLTALVGLLHFPAHDALAARHLEAGRHVLERQGGELETGAAVVGEVGSDLLVARTHVQRVLHVVAGVQVAVGNAVAVGAAGGVGRVAGRRGHRVIVGVVGEDGLAFAVHRHLLAALHIGGKRAQLVREVVAALVGLMLDDGLLVRVAGDHVGHR